MAKKRATAGSPPARRRTNSALLACSVGVVLLALGTVLFAGPSGSSSTALTRIAVFVVHYTPLVERKRQLQRQLRAQLARLPPGMRVIDVQWIVEHDREELKQDGGKHPYYRPFRHLHSHGVYSKVPLTAAEHSIMWKHAEALRRAAQLPRDHLALILEDDVELADDFFAEVQESVMRLPAGTDSDESTSWSILCLGSGIAQCSSIPDCARRAAGTRVYRKRWHSRAQYQLGVGNVMRLGDGYLVRPSSASLFLRQWAAARHAPTPDSPPGLDLSAGYSFPFDAEAAFWANELGLGVWWAEPPLLRQSAGGKATPDYDGPASAAAQPADAPSSAGRQRAGAAREASAIELHKQALKMAPSHPLAGVTHLHLGTSHLKRGNLEAAAAELASAVALCQSRGQAKADRTSHLERAGLAAANLALVRYNQQRDAEALQLLQQASQLAPKAPDVRRFRRQIESAIEQSNHS